MSEVYTPPGEDMWPFDAEEGEEGTPTVTPFEGAAVLLRFGRGRTPVVAWAHQPNKEL